MSNHPYAGDNTLTPGEMAEDDPFGDELYCDKCSEYVETVSERNTCPTCGSELK